MRSNDHFHYAMTFILGLVALALLLPFAPFSVFARAQMAELWASLATHAERSQG